MSEHMALENLTVLDLTRVLAGPFCTMMLADMGANVIKIEVPKGGDDTRSYPPFRAKNLNGERESVYFANINRNKKGITLNLKAPEGKEIFKELVKKADIVVENYRPGVMDKLGLGYDVLKEINPRIIYAAVSGFGCYGPYHLRPGYDILAQAMGGMMSITGSKGGEPTRAGSALGDILGGLHVTIGILAAVNARTITGKGQRVDVSLMDSMIAATENTALKYIETGNIPAPMGNRYAAVSPYDSFTCKGGKVIIAAGNQKLYEKLCNEVLERPDMEKVYVIEVESGKQEFDLYYSEEGILVKSVADTDNDSENYLPAEIPAAIETFIKKQYPNARLVEIEVEHGMTEVDIIDGNISKEIVFNSSNEWISTSWDVRRNELPETVTRAIASSEKYAGYQIDDADFVETPGGEYYLVELEKGELEVKVKVNAEGEFI